MRLPGELLSTLQVALEDAFRTPGELGQFVRYKLDYDLHRISTATDLSTQIYALISWAEANERLPELAAKAFDLRPKNSSVAAAYNHISSYLAKSSPELDPLLSVRSKSRYQVIGQIARFAKSKYIPRLYNSALCARRTDPVSCSRVTAC